MRSICDARICTMRSVLLGTWVLAMVLYGGTGPVAGQSVRVSVDPSSQDAALGATVEVTVRANTNGRTVGGAGLFLQFDSTRLRFVSGENGSAWNNSTVTTLPDETEPGVVSWSVGVNAPGLNGGALVVSTLRFEATAAGNASLAFLFVTNAQETAFTDLDLSPLPTDGSGGTVRVQTASVGVSLNPASQDSVVGATVSVSVRADTNGLTVGGAGLFLQFDNSRLRFLSGENDAAWNNSTVTTVPAVSEAGVVAWSVGVNAPGLNGGAVALSTLRFEAIAAGEASLGFLFVAGAQETQFTDLDLAPLSAEGEGGTVRISAVTPITPPTSTATATQTRTPTEVGAVTSTPSNTRTPTDTPIGEEPGEGGGGGGGCVVVPPRAASATGLLLPAFLMAISAWGRKRR